MHINPNMPGTLFKAYIGYQPGDIHDHFELNSSAKSSFFASFR
jgi:hypothetical protein